MSATNQNAFCGKLSPSLCSGKKPKTFFCRECRFQHNFCSDERRGIRKCLTSSHRTIPSVAKPFASWRRRSKAAAIFDIARTCAKIEPGDKTGWEREWLQLAQTTEAKAKSAAPPDGGTRRCLFFHANQYYRMSDVFLTYEQNDIKAERFRRAQDCFRAGAKLHEPKSK